MKFPELRLLYKKIEDYYELDRTRNNLSKTDTMRMRKDKELRLLNFSPKVTPDRYVWHLSSPIYRDSIFEKGIIPNSEEHNVVFVNNQIEAPLRMWPIEYDDSTFYFDWDNYNKDDGFFACSEMLLNKYDFWRVDTWTLQKNRFKIDPNDPACIHYEERLDKPLYGVRPDYYLYYDGAIPRETIKLFRYKQGSFQKYYRFSVENEPLDIQLFDGVVSVQAFDKANPYFLEAQNFYL
jgi:hypothetical protein